MLTTFMEVFENLIEKLTQRPGFVTWLPSSEDCHAKPLFFSECFKSYKEYLTLCQPVYPSLPVLCLNVKPHGY